MTELTGPLGGPIPSMLEALELEIEEIRKQGGVVRVQVRHGERIGDSERPPFLYRFVLESEIDLRDDTPVQVDIGDDTVTGEIVSLDEGVLVVALTEDAGEEIPTATVRADESFLLEALKETLEDVRDGATAFHREAAERIVGRRATEVGAGDPSPEVWEGGDSPNPRQRTAIRQALGSDTLFLWGPPGTGKTTTLARVVEAHYREGRSVLVVSNTNVAVDTALYQVARRLEGEPEFDEGAVLRLGPVVSDELRSTYGSQVVVEEVVRRLGADLREELESCRARIATLEAELEERRAALDEYERLQDAKDCLGDLTATIRDADTEIPKQEARAERAEDEIEELREKLALAGDAGTVYRFIFRLDPDRIERELEAAYRTVEAAEAAAEELRKERAEARERLPEMRDRIATLEERVADRRPRDELESRVEQIESTLEDIRSRVAEIEAELDSLERQVLERCRVMATTAYRTYLGDQLPKRFDVVVVDEASMLMLPLVFYAAGLGKESVVVGGDFRQLPPIVRSNDAVTDEWLKRDAFEAFGIPEALDRGKSPDVLVALEEQYRMREPICGVVNEFFYRRHPLTTARDENGGDGRFPLSDDSLLYVDTSPLRPWASIRLGTYSRYNILHALLVRNLFVHLREDGYMSGRLASSDAAAAISPYSAQAGLIESLLVDRLGDDAAGLAATVHRFQGGEKRAVVLDLPDSPGHRLGVFMRGRSIEDDGARLLNVAVSRARDHLLVVGNFDFLRDKAPAGAVVTDLLEHLEKKGTAIDPTDLLPLGHDDWIDGLEHGPSTDMAIDPGSAGIFDDATFYPAFRRDLRRAQRQIVIFSPFLTERGAGRWADELRAAAARDADVRIVTKPPEGGRGDTTELIDRLRAMGVHVDLRARMHEKIAVIDGEVLWHGSLNILSHRATSESMLRFEATEACEQLAVYVTSLSSTQGSLELGRSENPDCPECGRPMIWNNGRYGVWFECSCGKKLQPYEVERRRTRAADDGETEAGPGDRIGAPCPKTGCSGDLEQRSGRYGPFLGCSRYPDCEYTENF